MFEFKKSLLKKNNLYTKFIALTSPRAHVSAMMLIHDYRLTLGETSSEIGHHPLLWNKIYSFNEILLFYSIKIKNFKHKILL